VDAILLMRGEHVNKGLTLEAGMKATLLAASMVMVGCGVSTLEQRAGDESTVTGAQLAVNDCVNQVMADLDLAAGTYKGQPIAQADIQADLEACIAASGVGSFDGGILVPSPPSFDGGFPRPTPPRFDGGFPRPTPPSFDGGFPRPTPPSFDGGFPTPPSFPGFDGGFPTPPSFPGFDGGSFPRPTPPSVDGGFPDFSGAGQQCPANGQCGANLRCFNPLNETLPSPFARCIPN
jgi:hypothetical protein